MDKSKPSSWRNCVTCQLWNGPRKISTFRDHVEYKSDQDKGECVGGAWNRMEKTAMSNCNKWEKWSVLK